MRVVRIGLALVVALAVGSSIGSLPPARLAAAQSGDACTVLAASLITRINADCQNLGAGSICTAGGDIPMMLADAAEFGAGALDITNGEWSIHRFNIPLTEDADAPSIYGALFGKATLTRLDDPARLTVTTLPVQTYDELAVLLRTGASTNFPQVTRLQWKDEGQADARNANGSWVRVRFQDMVGWGRVESLNITGDVMSLPILPDTDLLPLHLFPMPFQAVTLNSAEESPCVNAGSGLLLQTTNAAPAAMLINGVAVTLSGGAETEGGTVALLKGIAKGSLEIYTLAGEVTPKALGKAETVPAGQFTRVRLGGADGMIAIAPPRIPDNYSFESIAGAPIDVLPNPAPCYVGVVRGDARASVHALPGDTRALVYLNPALSYPIVGQWTDAAGALWWRMNEKAERWIEAATVRAAGACAAVAKAEPSATTAARPAGGDNSGGNSGASGGVPGGGGFAPSAKTVWNVEVSNDQMVGTCGGGALNYCAHLAAITPSGSNLTWKGQELKVYTLRRVRENVYSYAGRNGLNDGNVEMVMVFNSPTTFTMNLTTVYDRESACQHIHTFTGAIR